MTLHILFAASFAFLMIEGVQWHRWHTLLDRRPFNCITCISLWSGLITTLLNGYGWQSIEAAFLSAMTGFIIDSLIKKYL
jgi:hypothetical protein